MEAVGYETKAYSCSRDSFKTNPSGWNRTGACFDLIREVEKRSANLERTKWGKNAEI